MSNNLSKPGTQQDIVWIQHWIHKHTGIWFPETKLPILEQRLISMCMKHGFKDFADLIAKIESSSGYEIINEMVDVATTNHTHFYRETVTIEYFTNNIANNYMDSSLRVWSAASSSGEELYTIILHLIEKYGFEKVKRHCSFLGTDLNRKVLEKAEQGLYPHMRLEGIPQKLINQWFSPAGLDLWSLDQVICKMCMFRTLNLLAPRWPFTKKFHVIFLRNVLYYFDTATQEAVLRKLYDVVEPGGSLITSVTESTSKLDVPWVRVSSGIYTKPR